MIKRTIAYRMVATNLKVSIGMPFEDKNIVSIFVECTMQSDYGTCMNYSII